MKQETFEKAQEIMNKIQDFSLAIDRVESGKNDCTGIALNFSFCYLEEKEALKDNVIKYLKNKKALLQKEFNNLK
jgi:hypothetical protein